MEAIHGSLAGLEVSPAVRARLADYVRLLLERNAEVNLTSARDPAAVVLHIRDSLSIASLVSDPLVDIGSGGGFPAIPLVIATGIQATLIEAAGKKAAFLRVVATTLELPVRIVNARAEDAARDVALRETFASATARAVGGAATVLELTLPFLRVGGIAVLQRGELSEAERNAAADAALVLGARFEDEHVEEAPSRRRVLLVRKVAPTGQRFPRRAGVPAKRPLCAEPADA